MWRRYEMLYLMRALLWLAVYPVIISMTSCQTNNNSRIYYVDPVKGNDAGSGEIDEPFQTLDHVLQVVNDRVDAGIRSDKIYLRGGVYRNQTVKTAWWLNLHGTPEDYAVLSAMPCEPNTPGAVQRKSGQWYENVVFDDGQTITTSWTRHPKFPGVWQTNPGFVQLEWTHQNLWPWTRHGYPITDKDETPRTTLFTQAPYMVLQDGEATLWKASIEDLAEPGTRTYDQTTGMLYFRTLGEKDPNTCVIETWYGGLEDYPAGTLYLDGEGRALFDGNMRYVALKGMEFRLCNRIFEFHRWKYNREEDRAIQQHVLVEDTFHQYGSVHIFQDANTVLTEAPPDTSRPRYDDMCDWTVRNNVFFRPAREVWQLYGDDHLFEFNEVIDFRGPWAGPAAISAVVNTRNTRNAKFRYNFIWGTAENPWWAHGSIHTMEIDRHHADANGDRILGGETIEYNIFAHVTQQMSIGVHLGRSTCRMQNVTIRHNVFMSDPHGPAVSITSPHKNLVIEHNVFYDQKYPIEVTDGGLGKVYFGTMPSTVFIRGNIFMNCRATVDSQLIALPEGTTVTIDKNLYWNSQGPSAGSNAFTTDPLFRNPLEYDFRLNPGSPAIVDGPDVGVYDADSDILPGTDWWNIRKGKWFQPY